MSAMSIRFRLTLWYTTLFAVLLITSTSIIYVAHRNSHYEEIDRLLSGVSLHLQEELERNLRQGVPIEELRLTSEGFAITGVYAVVIDPRGNKIVAKTDMIPPPPFPYSSAHPITNDFIHTVTDQNAGRYRMLIKPLHLGSQLVGYLQTEISLKRIDQALNRFGWFIVGIDLASLFLIFFGGWWLARQALYRVEIIRQTAKAIASSQGFDQRVYHEGPKDELGELTDTFNEMLDSLEKAYKSQSRFIADASHELRAPLTTIRGNLDILQRNRNLPPEEREEIIKDTRNEVIRMTKIVSDLLSLARADAGQRARMQVVNLSEVVREVVAELGTWEKDVLIRSDPGKGVTTWGDPDLIKQLLLILMENALRYTPEGGEVRIMASTERDSALLRVADTGIGMNEEEQALLFERFYRGEKARSMAPEGTGLGLSIAKWIVEQHNGEILVSSRPGQGSEFTIHLPKVQ